MSEKKYSNSDLYRHVLCELCKLNGGEIFVPASEPEAGTLMHRIEPDGVRFRFIRDGGVKS